MIYVPMYIETVPNRSSRPAILLRQGWREGQRVRKKTLANLTDWPSEKVEALRQVLKGRRLIAPEDAFTVERSRPHGHVEALLTVCRRLGLERLIAAKRCRERDRVLAMVLERLLHPASKLATTRLWHCTTLAEELGVGDDDEDDLYEAMDWLLERQERIEQRLGKRHLNEGEPVFADVSSSYYEGRTCPLMRFGYNRDRKRGKTRLVYAVLSAPGGCPVAVQAYPGNTADPNTVADQVVKLQERFGLERVALVGDRGLLTQVRIEHLKRHRGLGWVSALKSLQVRAPVEQHALLRSLFDEQNLAEIVSSDYPGERLVACCNPLLAEERSRKREELLTTTEAGLERVAREAARRTRTPLGAAELGRKVGRVLGRHKVGKHVAWEFDNARLRYQRNAERIEAEARLDGIYVLRTSEPATRPSPRPGPVRKRRAGAPTTGGGPHHPRGRDRGHRVRRSLDSRRAFPDRCDAFGDDRRRDSGAFQRDARGPGRVRGGRGPHSHRDTARASADRKVRTRRPAGAPRPGASLPYRGRRRARDAHLHRRRGVRHARIWAHARGLRRIRDAHRVRGRGRRGQGARDRGQGTGRRSARHAIAMVPAAPDRTRLDSAP